jgi:uncharacterized protein YebE (UPF0316 family)
MDFTAFINTETFSFVIIPLLIFFARILDVSIGTIRVVFISRGMRRVAPFLGFFEVLIWLVVVKQVMTGVTNFVGYIAYAGGFATGTYIGMRIEEKLAKGKAILRVVTRKESVEVIENLKENDFKITTMDAEGQEGPVKIIFMVLERHNIQKALDIIKKTNPRAFYSVEDVRSAREEHYPSIHHRSKSRLFFFHRKGK